MRLLKSDPVLGLAESHIIGSAQPSSLNYIWNFGSLLATCLVVQITAGAPLDLLLEALSPNGFPQAFAISVSLSEASFGPKALAGLKQVDKEQGQRKADKQRPTNKEKERERLRHADTAEEKRKQKSLCSVVTKGRGGSRPVGEEMAIFVPVTASSTSASFQTAKSPVEMTLTPEAKRRAAMDLRNQKDREQRAADPKHRAEAQAKQTAWKTVGEASASVYAEARKGMSTHSAPLTSTPLPKQIAFLSPRFTGLFIQRFLGAFLSDGNLQCQTEGGLAAHFSLNQGAGNPGGLGFVVTVYELMASTPGLLGKSMTFRGGPIAYTDKSHHKTGVSYSAWKVFTASLPEFGQLFRLFYVDGVKIFPTWLVPYADANFLAYLWSGDGCCPTRGYGPGLATDGFDKMSRDNIIQLHAGFGIQLYPIKNKQNTDGTYQYRLRIRNADKESQANLQRVVGSLVHSTMRYRLGLY